MALYKNRILIQVALLLSVATTIADAMPVAFQGALGVMSYNQPDFTDWQVSYSVTNRIGLGVDGIRDAMGVEQYYAIPRANFLLHRWNGSDFQANVYVYGGYGMAKRESVVQGAGFFGGEADYETRRLYVAGKASSLMARGFEDSTTYQLRLGVSPYLADFESLQSWLILQATYYTRQSPEQLRIGPVLRFFIKNILWEVGATAKGTWNINFMIHF